ncbi:MAG TPA: VIT domain-containing protein [Planctomycetota bacterium]|nr:VIT domain-containing protein [Planctomycetota bacterium]
MRILIAAVVLALGSAAARAGDMIPTDPRYAPLRVASHKVDVQVDNQIALTRVEQVFANDNPATLEAHYVFPVPKGASLIDFSMTVNGKLIRGELLEKDKARAIYEGIVQKSKDPGLLEQVGTNLFRVRVFPILPNAQQKIEMTYLERLTVDGGSCRFVYPLLCPGGAKTTKADDFDFRWRLTSAVPIKDLACPTHPAAISRQAEVAAEVRFSGHQIDLSKDLEISYRIERASSGMDLVTHRPKDEDGTFMLLLTPQVQAKRLPKDMTFVFDTSGSMEGTRIKQAKAALKFCLSKLQPDDRFNVLSFASVVTSLENDHLAATDEAKARAARFVDAFDASGGTNISGALHRALEHRTADGRPHQIVFLTDGEPTVGETRPEQIVRGVVASNRAGVRIYTFGVGAELNRGLLEDLAEATRGVAEFVSDQENIEEKISRLQRKIATPVLSDVTIDWGQAEVSAVYPTSPGDLFAGTQLILTGRYRKAGTFEVTMKGRTGTTPVELRQTLAFPERIDVAPGVPYLWAMRKVAAILDEMRRTGQNAESVGQVIALAKQYRIATPYTSFLVLESEAAFDQQGIDRKGNGYKPPTATTMVPGPSPEGRPLLAKEESGAGALRPKALAPEALPSDHNESADGESHREGHADFLADVTGDTLARHRAPGVYDTLGASGLRLGGPQRYANVFGNRDPGRKDPMEAERKDLHERRMAALFWLARHQSADGGWSAEHFQSACSGGTCEGQGDEDSDVGVTGLSVLAFLSAGYSQLAKEEYPDPARPGVPIRPGTVVKRALQWLLAHQEVDGAVGSRGAKVMYGHAIATLALSEAYGLTRSAPLKDPAQKAVDFLVASQNPGKGWRYSSRSGDSDTSVTGWAVMALKSAELADLTFPKSASDGAQEWIRTCTGDDTRRFRVRYLEASHPMIPGRYEMYDEHPTMTAVGILCRLLLQKSRKDPAFAGTQLLLEDLPDAKATKVDYNYWYFGSLALFQSEGPDGARSKTWGNALGKAMIPLQKRKPGGCIDGSWDPASPWGQEGGRVWATAISALTLFGCN